MSTSKINLFCERMLQRGTCGGLVYRVEDHDHDAIARVLRAAEITCEEYFADNAGDSGNIELREALNDLIKEDN